MFQSQRSYGALRPFERCRRRVIGGDESLAGPADGLEACAAGAAQRLPGPEAEPALPLVEPRSGRGRKVKMHHTAPRPSPAGPERAPRYRPPWGGKLGSGRPAPGAAAFQAEAVPTEDRPAPAGGHVQGFRQQPPVPAPLPEGRGNVQQRPQTPLALRAILQRLAGMGLVQQPQAARAGKP